MVSYPRHCRYAVASGYKIYPLEVEDVLQNYVLFVWLQCVGIPDKYRVEALNAYVALKHGLELTSTQLIGFCKKRLAAFKFRRQMAIIDEVPKNASGKSFRREPCTVEQKKHVNRNGRLLRASIPNRT
ncbi:Long-chain-fatty-acid--CoA ligase [Galdieria sulphuraria]|nr:Long-chain-fatty-acid--CoA ligase [Galdieria sulphuraria]